MACLLVYRKYADSVFAPLFHAIWPQQKFRKKPKYLSAVIVQLQYLRMSYPQWRGRLKRYIRTSTDMGDPCIGHAENLRQLMEFYIPAVRACSSIT